MTFLRDENNNSIPTKEKKRIDQTPAIQYALQLYNIPRYMEIIIKADIP